MKGGDKPRRIGTGREKESETKIEPLSRERERERLDENGASSVFFLLRRN